MDEAEAVELVKQAILSGVFNDLGSGSNVDVTVIRVGGETARCVCVKEALMMGTGGGAGTRYHAWP